VQKLKKYKSLIDIPVKVEMQPVEHAADHALTIDELAVQIEEAKKGKARVDSKYVNFEDRGHVFDYKLDYVRFLDNMTYIIKQAKARRAETPENTYTSKHPIIIQ
jgi:hypothetical protein